MVKVVVILSLLLLGCVNERPQYVCHGKCPDGIDDALEKIALAWSDHVYDPYAHWDRYQVTWEENPIFFRGRKVYGITRHDTKTVKIWYGYPCENIGLCAGVFDWEMGLILTEHILPNSTEEEKIEWRLKYGLINELK